VGLTSALYVPDVNVRPGFLTREFSAGRRARYVLPPVRLYVIVIIVFLRVLSLTSRFEISAVETSGPR